MSPLNANEVLLNCCYQIAFKKYMSLAYWEGVGHKDDTVGQKGMGISQRVMLLALYLSAPVISANQSQR